MRQFLGQMLVRDDKKRATAESLLRHEFLDAADNFFCIRHLFERVHLNSANTLSPWCLLYGAFPLCRDQLLVSPPPSSTFLPVTYCIWATFSTMSLPFCIVYKAPIAIIPFFLLGWPNYGGADASRVGLTFRQKVAECPPPNKRRWASVLN